MQGHNRLMDKRFSSMFSWICLHLYSSRRTLSWQYFGQKYIFRSSLWHFIRFNLKLLLLKFLLNFFLLSLILYELQARRESTDGVRPTFYVINVVIYTIQGNL
ncbi:auxin response factor 2-like isoform X1 [Iris pallida]|uniref:Auxin response factor 2-like isoform X1 n=1 Tax=Iris pallida TaxID=29817 RepID=A0AAX6FC36_IRIPA|nr:auxin response factor 2-like isoform X1 [Iris pallida]KAJ6839838.1 auxin response factor 2-like isoform X1 [Iris pallida]